MIEFRRHYDDDDDDETKRRKLCTLFYIYSNIKNK